MRHGQQHIYSRWVGLNAGLAILRQQQVVHRETTHPDGRLYGDIHVTNALHNGDFLLAAMIVCLALAYNSEEYDKPPDDFGGFAQDRMSLLSTLETTHEIFKDLRKKSVDSQRVCDALAIMLNKVNTGKAEQEGFSGDTASADVKEPAISLSCMLILSMHTRTSANLYSPFSTRSCKCCCTSSGRHTGPSFDQ